MLDRKDLIFGGAFFMKRKYTVELKLEIVQYYLSGKVSFKDAANKYHVNKSDIIKWVAAYREHGIEGLLAKNGTYTGDFKIFVVEYMHNTGSSARQTAAYFNIASLTSGRRLPNTFSDKLFCGDCGKKLWFIRMVRLKSIIDLVTI
jgi:transposase-like protein